MVVCLVTKTQVCYGRLSVPANEVLECKLNLRWCCLKCKFIAKKLLLMATKMITLVYLLPQRKPRTEIQVMWSQFVCPANQHPNSTIKEKSPQSFAHLLNFWKKCRPCLIIIEILLFWLSNKQTFHVFSLRFVLCSRDLGVLRAQRIMGFLILITHKPTRSENPIRWRGSNNDLDFMSTTFWSSRGQCIITALLEIKRTTLLFSCSRFCSLAWTMTSCEAASTGSNYDSARSFLVAPTGSFPNKREILQYRLDTKLFEAK